MMKRFAIIKAPVFGWGQIKLTTTGSFRKLDPEARMSIMAQIGKQARKGYEEAERDLKALRAKEDVANAAAIKLRA